MPEEEETNECVEEARKYADTVKILAAIKKIFDDHSNIAEFMGVEHTIKTDRGEIKPDIVYRYGRNFGLFFELKWHISEKTIGDELRSLKKYYDAKYSWKDSLEKVQQNDVILICHTNDLNIIINELEKISTEDEYSFLKNEGFSIWTWCIELEKSTGREEFRFRCEYGKTRNITLEKLINQKGGLVVPPEVLEYLGRKYLFIKDKPPIQYMMEVLYLHVFPSIKQASLKEVNVDEVYEYMKGLFPGWHFATEESIQAKKIWIREAIEKFRQLKIDKLPIKRPRKEFKTWICQKLVKLKKKEKRPIGKISKPKKVIDKSKFESLDRFFQQ
ncbi:MAG: hypothetical protein QXY79_04685 [Candidatus Methanomethylicia archaeon]